MIRPDKDLKRASAWMDFQIAELLNGDADEDAVANTLEVIYEYARSTKVGTPRWGSMCEMVADIPVGYIALLPGTS